MKTVIQTKPSTEMSLLPQRDLNESQRLVTAVMRPEVAQKSFFPLSVLGDMAHTEVASAL
jgi:hypothetical protein